MNYCFSSDYLKIENRQKEYFFTLIRDFTHKKVIQKLSNLEFYHFGFNFYIYTE